METSIERTDPILDNQPKHHSKGPQRLVYILLAGFGLTIIGFGAHELMISQKPWVAEVSIALGVAIAAPSILSYMYRRYLLDDIKAELDRPAREFKEAAAREIEAVCKEISIRADDRSASFRGEAKAILDEYHKEIALLRSARQAGLRELYSSRREAVGAFLQFLEEEEHNVLVLGSSLLGFLQEPDKEYEDARALLQRRKDKGVRIRFLLTHPMIADLRAEQESRRPKDIGYEILKSLRILLDEWGIEPEDIKLYKGTPTCFGLRTGTAMLLNFYPYMKEAYASPCLIVQKGGYFYDHFDNSHFRAWNSVMAQRVPSRLAELESMLDEFSLQLQRLMELGANIDRDTHSGNISPNQAPAPDGSRRL